MSSSDRVPAAQVLAQVLAGVRAAPAVIRPLTLVTGQVLAADVRAPVALPPEHRSAMDGLAVRAADVAAARDDAPVRLAVHGASLAGLGDRSPLPVGAGRVVATGAPVPPGADAVVRVEDVERDADTALVRTPVAAGHDVRPAGEDLARGAVLVRAGRLLDTGAVGGLAGAGITEVPVVPAPRVRVVPTGDEVVAGTTPDAVGPALWHLLTRDGAVVEVTGAVPDEPDALRAAVTAAAAEADLVVTVGGVSVGPRDHAGDVVASLATGATTSLALRPGRPFAWGRTDDGTTVCCLPGTPLAALTAAVLLVRPVVAMLAGRPAPRTVTAVLGAPTDGDPRLRTLVPAAAGDDGLVRPVPGNGAADLARLAATSVLLDLPAGTGRLDAGAAVDAWWLP